MPSRRESTHCPQTHTSPPRDYSCSRAVCMCWHAPQVQSYTYGLKSPISPKIHSRTFPHAFPFHTFPPHTHAVLMHTDGHRQTPIKLQKSLCAGTFPSHHIPTLFRAESEGRSYVQLVPQRESREAAVSSNWSPARTPTAPACMLGQRASGASVAVGG